MSISWQRRSYEDYVLDKNISIDVLPSDKIYYYDYPYKVQLEGNSAHYNIKNVTEINGWLWYNYQFEFKSQFTTKYHNIYFKNRDSLYAFCERYMDKIINLYGPINVTHFNYITNRGSEKWKINNAYRTKLWYGRYDAKIEVFTPLSSGSREAAKKQVKDFAEYIATNLEHKQWHSNIEYMHTWHANYLYCKQDELEELIPWMKLCYDEIIRVIYYIDCFGKSDK